jgi:lipoprotein signal peptidase
MVSLRFAWEPRRCRDAPPPHPSASPRHGPHLEPPGGRAAATRRVNAETRRTVGRIPGRPRSIVRRLLGERRAAERDAPGRRRSDEDPLHGWRPALAIALAVALADWLGKLAVALTLPVGEFREIVTGRIALWHVRNDAMILGLWENLPLDSRKVLATVAAVLAVVALLQIVGRAHRLPVPHRRWAWLFVGMMAGGMLGNLGERVLHWWVTDYLSVRWGSHWLPPGNIADLALFLSIPLAIPVIALELRERARRGSGRPRDRPAAGGGDAPAAA